MKRTAVYPFVVFIMAVLVLGVGVLAQTPDTIVNTGDDTSSADPADITLREAIATGGGDYIQVASSVGTITLTDGEIPVTANMTIDLNDATVTTTTANRIFNISSAATVELLDGTLDGGGNVVAGDGGLVYTEGRFRPTRVTFQNGLTDSTSQGGAIYVTGANSDLVMDASTVTGNQAQAGGGIYLASNSLGEIRNSDIHSNSLSPAAATSQRLGAGIASVRYLTINESRVYNNMGAYRGGGIYSIGSTLVVNRTQIYNNEALENAGADLANGGGVFVGGGATVTFIGRSSLYGNQSSRGGAIATTTRLDVYNSTIDANDATDATSGGGGAVFVNDGGRLVSSFVTYSDNTSASGTTPGIWVNNGNAVLKASVLDNASLDNCETGGSGVITDQGENIESGTTCGFGASSIENTDPVLAGVELIGSGRIRPLDTGSPALDAVSNCTVSSQARAQTPLELFDANYQAGALVREDQRSAPRTPLDSNCDIGAYETTIGGTADVVFTRVQDVTLAEDGSNYAEYSVQLTSQPVNDGPTPGDPPSVVVGITPDAELQVSIDAGATLETTTVLLTFGEFDWATPQYVRVYGQQDTDQENPNPHVGVVTHTIDSSNDSRYDALTPANVDDLSFDVSDDDWQRTVAFQNAVTAAESAGTFNFSIGLDDEDNPLTTGDPNIIVTYRTLNRSATAPDDYEAVSNGEVIFEPGDVVQVVSIDVVDDNVDESDEQFIVEITSVQGAQIGTPSSVFGTITDNDGADSASITILPEELDVGRVGDEYSVTFTASGGTAPYVLALQTAEDNAFPGDDWEFDAETGTLSGTPDAVAEVTFTVSAVDANGAQGDRTYTAEFTLTGESGDIEPTEVPTLTPEQIEAQRQETIRQNVGPPVVEIDPNSDLRATYVRSGPAIGATIINVAQANRSYTAVGRYTYPGGEEWFLIEYTTEREITDAEGNPATITETERGWVVGADMLLSGFIPDLPTVGNPFDSISQAGTGVLGASEFKNNLYRYPTPNGGIVQQFDEGTPFEVLGRTRVDGRQLTDWLYVRLGRGGAVGWLKYTPYLNIEGDLTRVPSY